MFPPGFGFGFTVWQTRTRFFFPLTTLMTYLHFTFAAPVGAEAAAVEPVMTSAATTAAANKTRNRRMPN